MNISEAHSDAVFILRGCGKLGADVSWRESPTVLTYVISELRQEGRVRMGKTYAEERSMEVAVSSYDK